MPVNVATGVKVTAPVAVFTVYVPCPATVSVVTGLPEPSSSRTVFGTIAAPVEPGVSLAAGLTVIGVFCGVVPVSGVAAGGGGAPTVTV